MVVENAFGRLTLPDMKLVTSMVYACCALHNLYENHGETYDIGLDVHDPARAVAGAEGQGAEEEGKDVREGLMGHLLLNN